MPTTSDADGPDPTEGERSSSAGASSALTPAEREELLANNRRTREELRAAEAKKAAAGADEETPDVDEAADGASDTDPVDPSRVPGKVVAEPSGASGGRKLIAGLVALIVALAVAVGVLGYLLASADRGVALDSGAGEQALADAKTYAAEVVTYGPGDYSDLDRRIREFSTSDFADRYIQASQDARRGTDEAKASSIGTAIAAGAESITDEEAVVLVALDQKVTSPELPAAGDEGLEYQTRVRVTLQRDGDRWVLSDLVTI
ncbi:hypothetical protein [Gordonia caeni]